MFLAEMSSNAVINCSTDLEFCDMNWNYDWINDARQQYSNADLMDANTFVNKTSGNGQENTGEEKNEVINYQTLNEKQRMVFERIESHYNNVLAGQQVGPLRIIVMGITGTGKTYLIKGIRG